MKEFIEYLPNNSSSEKKKSSSEKLIRERLEGVLDTVTVGGVKIKPWETRGIFTEKPDKNIFSGKEIQDVKERDILTHEAVVAAQEILRAYYKIDTIPDDGREHVYKDLAGLCKKGSMLVQELLARANVRTILVYGEYDASKTERHMDRPDYSPVFSPDEDTLNAGGIYGHYWLYESQTGVIPISTEHAHRDTILIDPTRSQFHFDKPKITHPNEGKYKPEPIGSSPKNTFFDANGWLWNEEELKQWKEILNSMYRDKE